MTRYIPMKTPGGVIWTEIEDHSTANITLTSVQEEAIKSFKEAVGVLEENAKYIIEEIKKLDLDEIEVSFGIKAGVEGGTPFFGLAKATGEGSYEIKVKWTKKP